VGVQEKFAKIAETTVREAGAVSCSLTQYKEGLEEIAAAVEAAINAAEEDIEKAGG